MKKFSLPIMKKIASICIIVIIFAIGQERSHASLISGVTASTNMLSANGTNIANIVNGSGLPGNVPALTGIHALINTGNVWISGYKYGSVIFDLHGLYRVDGMSIWPFNGNNTVCIRDVKWLVSTDGTNFTLLSNAPTVLPQGPWVSAVSPTYYVLSGFHATHIRLDVYSNYGYTSSSGLAEIQFDGIVVPSNIDMQEFAILSAWWGVNTCNVNNAFCNEVDYNRSGSVDLNDLCILAEYWLE